MAIMAVQLVLLKPWNRQLEKNKKKISNLYNLTEAFSFWNKLKKEMILLRKK